MIEAIRGKGVNRARVVCDVCGRDDTVPCGYVRTSPHSSEPNRGQIIKKLESHGWSEVKGDLRCPACEAKRKVEASAQREDAPMAVKDEVRKPTPKQKREIIGILEMVYDDERKRFKDGESDKTVADAIGDGVLWGWVAEVREELFGPDSRNQELDAIQKEAKRLGESIAAVKSETAKMIAGCEAKINELNARLEKVMA